jgi:hypothetical protein
MAKSPQQERRFWFERGGIEAVKRYGDRIGRSTRTLPEIMSVGRRMIDDGELRLIGQFDGVDIYGEHLMAKLSILFR